MISKKKAKYIISLQKKKVRDKEGLFVIEGDKLVKEFLSSGLPVKYLLAEAEFLSSFPPDKLISVNEIDTVSYRELKQISTLKTPQNALAVLAIPDKSINLSEIFKQLTVALDFVQDPGNLGTIIRAAAWFGIKNIVCSSDCVDVYNPKVIQASMGALLHVNIFYYDLKNLLTSAGKEKIRVFGALLEGNNIYSHNLDNKGIIVLGNESKGISDELIPFITDEIMIPKFNDSKPGIDSLNVGMAASVIFSEFTRRSL